MAGFHFSTLQREGKEEKRINEINVADIVTTVKMGMVDMWETLIL